RRGVGVRAPVAPRERGGVRHGGPRGHAPGPMRDASVRPATDERPADSASRGHVIDERELQRMIEPLVLRYPEELQPDQRRDVARTAFHVSLVASAFAPPAKVCDIGGGVGLFSLACAHLGYEMTLVDDFSDPVNER